MRKKRILLLIAIMATVAVGCYYAMPPKQSVQCYKRIKIGMKYEQADSILIEHGFRLIRADVEASASFVYENKAENREIQLSVARRFGVAGKHLVKRDSMIRRLLSSFNIK